MNTLSGRVIHRESGLGIADLLVVIYDMDPGTRSEESEPTIAAAMTTVTTSATMVSMTDAIVGDRIASLATDKEGRVALTYEDAEFRIRNEGEKRPDLLLMVLAPEEPGQDLRSSVLYVARSPRHNAGRTESFIIRLNTKQLTDAGIPLPTLPRDESEDSQGILAQLKNTEARRAELSTGVTEIAKTRVADTKARMATFENTVKPMLHNFMSRLEESVLAPERIVLPGDSVTGKSSATIKREIEDVVNSTAPGRRAPVRTLLNLTDDQKTALEAVAAADGTVDAADMERVVGSGASAGSSTFLLRENQWHQFCREFSERERECASLLGETVPPLPPADPAVSPAPEPADTITDADMPRYLAHLMETMTSPEEQVVNGLTPRATNAQVQKQIKELAFEKSPADVPAYHDFHNLQIAFEHVWQEAIDEGVLALAEDAYDAIVELGGDPVVPPGTRNPLGNLLAEGALVLRANRDHRNGGSATTATAGGIVRDHRTGSPTIRDHRNGGGGEWRPGGTVVVPGRPQQPPEVRLPDVLTALEQRVKENYNFTVYAANSKERSINFGLLVTYRQEWTPVSYQAGELVKTLTLAPKQTQKVTVTRKEHKKRFRKEVENNLRSWREETSQTTRAEQEIIRRASTKTNFSVTSQETFSADVPGMGGGSGSITTGFNREASRSSDDIKKSFHEAVFKASQEYKNERTTEVTTEETTDFESVESTEIMNPNDEIAVTFLFYELQRRFRVREAIHKLAPVILVAQEMPRPQDIDADWLLTHDWVLRRVILDDSFLPAFDYLAQNVAGDEVALAEMRINIEQQRKIVDQLQGELVATRRRAAAQQAALGRGVWQKLLDADKGDGGGGGLLGSLTGAVGGLIGDVGGFIVDAADKIGDKVLGPDAPRSQTAHDAAKEAAERAADEARDLMFRLEREVTALNALLEKYAKAYADHINRLTQIARLRVHVKQNILYYMQAIWNHEPPDQRFFRLHNTKTPTLRYIRRKFVIDFTDVRINSMVNMPHRTLPRFSTSPVRTYPAEIRCEINPQLEFVPLSQVADLDTLLGFKGNYAIFPLKQSNALTDFMMEPYVDRGLNQLIDPDDIANWTLEEFACYVCCLKERLPQGDFNVIKPQLKEQYKALLSAPRRSDEMITIPSGSLFIEALPATHSLIEEFKARHRAVDVKKVQAEVRRMELENIRYASRVLESELDDPDVDKKIIIEGGQHVVVPPDV